MWPFSETYPEVIVSSLQAEYDFIVVGGGTAGCLLARRLSENDRYTVLVVERGGAGNSWLHRNPLLSMWHASNRKHGLEFETADEGGVGRKLKLVAGKGIGGTSRINALQYNRSSPAEYNAWAESGRKGWSYDELKPYFLKSECNLDVEPAEHHGTSGEWKVRTYQGYYFASAERASEAAARLGFPLFTDWNVPLQPKIGCTKAYFTVDEHGERSSGFSAFLPLDYTVAHKSNLHVCTNALVHKLDIRADSDGYRRVHGIRVQQLKGDRHSSQKIVDVSARREVIVTCGAFGSPQLLMLSGIGPAARLREQNIPVLADHPGVGMNLSDHIGCNIGYNCPPADSLSSMKNPATLLRQFFRYIFHGDGWLLAPMVETCIYARVDSFKPSADGHASIRKEDLDLSEPGRLPDFAIMSLPVADVKSGTYDLKLGLYSLLVSILRPRSRGRVTLRSADPADIPLVEAAYLTAPEDRATLRAAVRQAVRIGREMQASGYALKEADVPSDDALQDDEKLDDFVRPRCDTHYHYAGTCRMAPLDDAEGPGVVDDELRVHGIRGLRIADASVLPRVTAAHTQAPVVVIAEKCADMVLVAAQKPMV